MQYRKPIVFPALAVILLSVTGCAGQPPSYSWSHEASGEYLFAYDIADCEASVTRMLAVADHAVATTSAPFFACMSERGYFLVDPASGRPLADSEMPEAVLVSQQAAR